MHPGAQPGPGLLAGGGAPLEVTAISPQTSTVNATTYTFSITVPEAGLLVIGWALMGSNSRLVSSVTYDGVGVSFTGQPTSGRCKVAISYGEVSAGTFNVSVTLNGSNGPYTSCLMFPRLLTGYRSATPHDTDAIGNTSGITTLTPTLDLPAGGFCMFAATLDGAHASKISWSSANELYDQVVGFADTAVAEINPTTAVTGHVETVTWGITASKSVVAASFR